ncbi:hypothetical protein Y1Q_0016848 [Alligator mississippiensis]|uniref:Uncharacterized protein n=1 Tax=Alligator mississippiensis TaxID=8496 RepID=A0A151P7K3_ALLMI|nr:hypothetical protein Y1Q_0016848 [Alligator mississippiensis]
MCHPGNQPKTGSWNGPPNLKTCLKGYSLMVRPGNETIFEARAPSNGKQKERAAVPKRDFIFWISLWIWFLAPDSGLTLGHHPVDYPSDWYLASDPQILALDHGASWPQFEILPENGHYCAVFPLHCKASYRAPWTRVKASEKQTRKKAS